MPQLWKRIEARRVATVSVFRRWAQVCVMATVALTLLIGAVLIPALPENPPRINAELCGRAGRGAFRRLRSMLPVETR